MILNKKTILEANDVTKKLVKVPEWGGEVYVRSMSGEDRDRFENLIVQSNGKSAKSNLENFRAKLASMTLCDEAGVLLFNEEDVKALSKKSATALQRIFVVAQKLSRIGDNDIEELTRGLQENPLEGSASA
jgi:hypothetical protein